MALPKTADPTPQQIAELCLEIRSTWTAAERRRRAGSYAEAEIVPLPTGIDLGHTFEFTDSADVG